MKKSSMRGSPDTIQGALDDCKDPRAGPQHNYAAGNDHSGADVRQRSNCFVQKLARARIDVDDVLNHLSAGRNLIAQGQQQKERREQRHQTEIAHRRRRCEEIVFVKLMDGMRKHAPPGRTVSDSE